MANRDFTAQVLCSYHYLKPSKQFVKAASKARSILGWINRHFGSLNDDEFKILYKTYVRPHVEFWYRILYPNLVSISSEKYQMPRKDSTKSDKNGSRVEEHCLMMTDWKFLDYFHWRKKTSRLLIEVFKTLTDRRNIDKYQFFTPSLCSHLRGHSVKLLKPRSITSEFLQPESD